METGVLPMALAPAKDLYRHRFSAANYLENEALRSQIRGSIPATPQTPLKISFREDLDITYGNPSLCLAAFIDVPLMLVKW